MLNLVHSVGNVRLDCLHLHVIIGVYLFAVRYKLQNMLLVCVLYTSAKIYMQAAP